MNRINPRKRLFTDLDENDNEATLQQLPAQRNRTTLNDENEADNTSFVRRQIESSERQIAQLMMGNDDTNPLIGNRHIEDNEDRIAHTNTGAPQRRRRVYRVRNFRLPELAASEPQN